MWKEIPWTKGDYSASDGGLIKSNDRKGTDGRILKGKLLKPWLGNHAYLMVCLMVEGKKYRRTVHSLIADTFMDEGIAGTETDYRDGNKLNNAAINLEWVTRKENLRRAKNLGLIVPSERQKEIRRQISFISREINKKSILQYNLDGTFIKKFEALDDVHKDYGYDISAVSRVAYSKPKTSYGYLWKWDDDSVTTIPKGSSRTGVNPAAKDESRKV